MPKPRVLKETPSKNYLEQIDDRLPMRSSGAWAEEKLDYLARYINGFETSMRSKWPVRNFIDLLAGPGKNKIRETSAILLGSPLIALTTPYPFTGYFFVDRSEENTRALNQRCTVSPIYDRVNIRTGDCNKEVDAIIRKIKPDDSRSLNLAFLDPEGFELQWATIEKLASVRRMDLIINYSQMGIERYISQAFNSSKQTKVDLFFGGNEWRTIYATWQGKSELQRRLMDHYKAKLRDLGYTEVFRGEGVGTEPLIKNQEKNVPLYSLIFASKHNLGHKIWKSIIRKNVYGQTRMDL